MKVLKKIGEYLHNLDGEKGFLTLTPNPNVIWRLTNQTKWTLSFHGKNPTKQYKQILKRNDKLRENFATYG